MSNKISKSLLRKTILSYRRLIESSEWNTRNAKVCERLFEAIKEEENVNVIHTFLPIKSNNEVDVTPILEELITSGFQIVISKTNFSQKSLDHFYYDLDTILEKNKLGIPEPVKARPANFQDVDLVLIPLVIGDKFGNRLGYGGGFYDCALKNTETKKIGLCLTPLLDNIQQMENWDVPLDQIITPFK